MSAPSRWHCRSENPRQSMGRLFLCTCFHSRDSSTGLLVTLMPERVQRQRQYRLRQSWWIGERLEGVFTLNVKFLGCWASSTWCTATRPC